MKLEEITNCSNPLHGYAALTIQQSNVTKSFAIHDLPPAPKLGEGECFVIS